MSELRVLVSSADRLGPAQYVFPVSPYSPMLSDALADPTLAISRSQLASRRHCPVSRLGHWSTNRIPPHWRCHLLGQHQRLEGSDFQVLYQLEPDLQRRFHRDPQGRLWFRHPAMLRWTRLCRRWLDCRTERHPAVHVRCRTRRLRCLPGESVLLKLSNFN